MIKKRRLTSATDPKLHRLLKVRVYINKFYFIISVHHFTSALISSMYSLWSTQVNALYYSLNRENKFTDYTMREDSNLISLHEIEKGSSECKRINYGDKP